MLRRITWSLGATGATALVVLTAAGATAVGPGEDYGQHVRTCAQATGFDGEHNPGMHRGFAGWDPTHVC